MIGELSVGVARLLDGFTLKRLVGLIIILGVFLFGLLAYDRLTSGFKLARLERAAEIVAILSDVGPSAAPSVLAARDRILTDLQTALDTEPFPLSLPLFTPPRLGWRTAGKFLAGFAPWLLFSLIATGTRGESFRGGCLLMWFFGIILGAVNVFIPDFLGGWFNFVVAPLFLFFVVIGMVVAMTYGWASVERKESDVR